MRRSRQLFMGRVSAVFFLLAALALLDGLMMLVRTSADEITLRQGAAEGLSGPCPFKNPVESDIEVRLSPEDAPLSFEFEGFFAGYLVGNGMWRGKIRAATGAPTMDCQLQVGFRGAGGQRFIIHVYHSERDYRCASPSFSIGMTGINPFMLAGGIVLIALGFALVTLVLGRMNLALLTSLGWAEIFRTRRDADGSLTLWCSAGDGSASTPSGSMLQVISPEGDDLGRARTVSIAKNVLTLVMGADTENTPSAKPSAVLENTAVRGPLRPGFGPLLRQVPDRKTELRALDGPQTTEKVSLARVSCGCLVGVKTKNFERENGGR